MANKINKRNKKSSKQSYLDYALHNLVACAELYSKTLNNKLDNTIYAYASEEEDNEEDISTDIDSGFDYKKQLAEMAKKITR